MGRVLPIPGMVWTEEQDLWGRWGDAGSAVSWPVYERSLGTAEGLLQGLTNPADKPGRAGEPQSRTQVHLWDWRHWEAWLVPGGHRSSSMMGQGGLRGCEGSLGA